MPGPIGNKHAVGNDGGRPTTYKPEYVGKVFEYLQWCKDNPIVIQEKTRTTAERGMSDQVKEEVSERPPSVAGLSVWLKMPRTTLQAWAERNDEFSAALEHLEGIQEQMLVEKGYSGAGNPRFNQFILSARHGYREKTEQDITSGGKPLVIPSELIGKHEADPSAGGHSK
ncbi:MAG: hypothetical protein E6Q97_07280 [Desulfurellales bacterium]|nr:MAG: hypothetical protein E6Q97_07280 [Desulfurellales bacterium]